MKKAPHILQNEAGRTQGLVSVSLAAYKRPVLFQNHRGMAFKRCKVSVFCMIRQITTISTGDIYIYFVKFNNQVIMENTYNNMFSIFSHGYVNREGKTVLATKPQQDQTILWTHQYITSSWCAGQVTETLRQMAGNASKDEIADYKKLNFQIALFAGTFSYRNARGLITPTPYMVLDIDGLDSTEQAVEVRERLSHDPNIETELCFISPKGLGVKWVVTLPLWTDGMTFKKKFEAMRDYTCFHHGIDPDTSGSDISRACFLPYDPDCFINTKYLQK